MVGNTKFHFTKSEVPSAGKTMIQKATESAYEWVFYLTRQLLSRQYTGMNAFVSGKSLVIIRREVEATVNHLQAPSGLNSGKSNNCFVQSGVTCSKIYQAKRK